MCAVAVNGQFSPGDNVDGYVIEQRLGAGGFGEVFRATERSPQRQVALKFVRPEFAADPVFVERFEREVNAMARVAHPHIVPIYAVDPGLRYFSMRYVAGGSLDAVLEERRLTRDEIVDVLAGVAQALDFCHARGIIHRDLKPANVLVDSETGCGLLADFGIAHAEDFPTLTGPGNPLGTFAYMAPETLLGERATAASDLWALGAMAYRVVTDRLPRGLSESAETEPIPPSRRNGRLGPDVDRVILRALSIDPAHRYGDARTFVSDLRDALARPVGRTAATRRVRSRRFWSVAASVVVLAPVAVYGLHSFSGQAADCNPNYTGACLKPDSGDYDCKGGRGDGPNYVGAGVRVAGRDEYGLDLNGDGVAC